MARSIQSSLALTLIMLLAIALRWHGLDAGLWYDEIITLTDYVRLPLLELLQSYGSPNNHILYSWLSKLAVSLVGESPSALRLPAFLFGVLSVWAVYRFAVLLMADRWALIITLLLTLSYHHVWFSQNARGYTGLLLFATLSSLLLNKGLQDTRHRWWLLYSLCVAFSLLLHLSSVVFFAVQGLVVVGFVALRQVEVGQPCKTVLWRRLAFSVAMSVGVTTFLMLPIFPALTEFWVAKLSIAATEPTAATMVEWTNPLWTLLETMRSFGFAGQLAPIVLVPVVVGAWQLGRTHPLLILPYILHIPFTLLLISAVGMNLWPRYFFVDMGALLCCSVFGSYTIIEMGLKRLPFEGNTKLAGPLKALGTVAVLAIFVTLLGRNYSLPKQDFSGALNLVQARTVPGDVVVTAGLAERAYGDFLAPDWSAVDSTRELERLTRSHRRVWVVTAFENHLKKKYPEVYLVLQNEFQRVEKFPGTLAGGDVFVYSYESME